MKNFRPEVEARLRQYHEKNGGVFFGGELEKNGDWQHAIPDSRGAYVNPQVNPPQ